MSPGSAWAGAAALFWTLTCVRWFDTAAPLRPDWLAALPPALLFVPAVVAAVGWLRAWREPAGLGACWRDPELLLAALLAFAFRLPLAWQGSAAYLTSDGALSGIVALRARDGAEHFVFVPAVPYSGSLKSHLTAALAMLVDPSRAFALWSVLFYVAFVAAVFLLGRRLEQEDGGGLVALPAALYLAFAPAFVTRYSLSNDGNYVEVLAFGTWALALTVEWIHASPAGRPRLAALAGALLGLAIWCHLLAVIHAAAIALVLLLAAPKDALRSAPGMALAFVLGAMPSVLWNATNAWESVFYLLPSGTKVGPLESGPPLAGRLWGLVSDVWPVLLGYDAGYTGAVEVAFRLFSGAACLLSVAALGAAATAVLRARRLTARPVLWVLLLFTLVNVVVAVTSLPYLPGNARYVLFLAAPLPLLMARLLGGRVARAGFALLVAWGAATALVQAPGAFRSDAQWRTLVATLQAEGVRHCYTDFFLATKINFLSEEKVVCSGKLGPTTVEYFFEYRTRVEQAPEAALIAVNGTAAEKLEKRLERLGVSYERRDLMKPVLLHLSRKVDPAEIFPGREFPLR